MTTGKRILSQEAQIQATGLAPTNDDESAIDITLAPGFYTALASGKDNTTGLAVIEVYDLGQAVPAKLANISTRALVGTAENIVIAGFTLGGNSGSDKVAVRGLGPSLTAGGVPNRARESNSRTPRPPWRTHRRE